MSATSHSGLEGVSVNSIAVSGRTASRQASMSRTGAKLTATPNFAMYLPNRFTVVPNTSCEQTTWSPALSSAIAVLSTAAMPDAVATAASAPSSAARRSSNARTVGFV